MNLLTRRRFHVPNRLAILAAVLLLISSVASNNSQHATYSPAQQLAPAMQIKSTEHDHADPVSEHRHHRLNLGLLLFRRG